MFKNLLKRKEGFTIVEVMIVLAIAGLIILIVFLAVPALQRNSRNTQRNNDASLIGAAVNECLNNRNGQISACGQSAVADLNQFLDKTKLRQLTDIAVSTAMPGAGETAIAHIAYSRKCNAAGSAAETGASNRAVAILFRTESSGGDNIPRCQEI